MQCERQLYKILLFRGSVKNKQRVYRLCKKETLKKTSEWSKNSEHPTARRKLIAGKNPKILKLI